MTVQEFLDSLPADVTATVISLTQSIAQHAATAQAQLENPANRARPANQFVTSLVMTVAISEAVLALCGKAGPDPAAWLDFVNIATAQCRTILQELQREQ